VLKFGPYIEFPDRWGSKIDFWPAREDKIEELLAGDEAITAESLAKGGTLTRGLPVIEYLLYSMDEESFEAESRWCELLVAATEDLVVMSGKIHDAWAPDSGGFLSELTEAGLGSETYPVVKAGLGEVLNRFGHTVENIRVMKLQEPLGETAEQANSGVLESRFSGRSHEDIRDNLRGIETLYLGDGSAETFDSVQDLLISYGIDYAGVFRDHFDASMAAVDAIPEPLSGSLTKHRDAVQNAIDVLGELQRFIQVDLLGVFSLDLSFNDADGD
jgi:predicted lipoprotein